MATPRELWICPTAEPGMVVMDVFVKQSVFEWTPRIGTRDSNSDHGGPHLEDLPVFLMGHKALERGQESHKKYPTWDFTLSLFCEELEPNLI